MLKQVSIYAENRKGTMQKITAVLLQEDINILGSVTNDSCLLYTSPSPRD